MTDDEYNDAIEWHMQYNPVYRAMSAVIDAMDADGYADQDRRRSVAEGLLHELIEPGDGSGEA